MLRRHRFTYFHLIWEIYFEIYFTRRCQAGQWGRRRGSRFWIDLQDAASRSKGGGVGEGGRTLDCGGDGDRRSGVGRRSGTDPLDASSSRSSGDPNRLLATHASRRFVAWSACARKAMGDRPGRTLVSAGGCPGGRACAAALGRAAARRFRRRSKSAEPRGRREPDRRWRGVARLSSQRVSAASRWIGAASCGRPSSISCHGTRAVAWVCDVAPQAAPGVIGQSSGWSSEPRVSQRSAAVS